MARMEGDVLARIVEPIAKMNQTEAAYAQTLEIRKRAGEIADYRFGKIKLGIGKKCWYTPDFLVIHADGTLEFVEVKGFWRDDARVKWRACADMYPWFRWSAVQRKKGCWKIEEA